MTLLPPHPAMPPLDHSLRGVPPGTRGLAADEVAAQRWHPAEGVMALPVLTLDLAAYAHNRDSMLRYAREQGVLMAPHGKTPMAPVIAADLVAAGAWGVTVADIRQAGVMLDAGLDRLILANSIGGRGGARRLAALLRVHPQAELHLFVDSPEAAAILDESWAESEAAEPGLPPLRILVELGAARGGARTLQAARAIIAIVAASEGRLILSGVGAYEGSVARPTPAETATVQAALFRLAANTLALVRAEVGPAMPLILTVGGSVYFDRVVAALRPVAEADGATRLILRGGAIFFHDHGVYERGLAALDARGGFTLGGAVTPAGETFRPSLRVWAEVLSRPEPPLAVCGLGLRDVAADQGLPVPLALYRDGRRLRALTGAAEVTKLNDQHAFVELTEGVDVRLGDVVEFGLSHPCTCLDRYRVIFGLGEDGRVETVVPTFFG